ncbi:hypothetical protein AA0111_g1777 [Alternaria arborescens]|uniref:hypothetical protein n=1 Tax=Alternaria arborescens TaxID=156630 RepID=UPI001075509B|nr:hypothetical protein AA0111_g1777 [Alternaria arborescens]RYO39243.1 hypothetical protein AA0111_g1777 [Alternaria arborescens]
MSKSRNNKRRESKQRHETRQDDLEENDHEAAKVGGMNADSDEDSTMTEPLSDEEEQDDVEDEASTDGVADGLDQEVPQALQEEDRLVRQLEGFDGIDGEQENMQTDTNISSNGGDSGDDGEDTTEPATAPVSSKAHQRAQALAAIRKNWNIEHVHDILTEETWLTGPLKLQHVSDDTWELATLLKFQQLSEQTKAMNKKMKEQFVLFWDKRRHTGGNRKIGRTGEEKEVNLRDDIRRLFKGDRIDPETHKETIVKAKNDGNRSGSKKRKSAGAMKRNGEGEPEQEVDDNGFMKNESKRPRKNEQQPGIQGPQIKTRSSTQRDMTLDLIYRNWNIASLLDLIPSRLTPAGVRSDADFDSAIVAGLLVLSNLTNTQERRTAVRQEFENAIGWSSRPSVDNVLSLIARIIARFRPTEQPESNIDGRPLFQSPINQTLGEVAASNLGAQARVEAAQETHRQRPLLPAHPRVDTVAEPLATESGLRRALDELDTSDAEILVRQGRRRLAYFRSIGVSTEEDEMQLEVVISLRDHATYSARTDYLLRRLQEQRRGARNGELATTGQREQDMRGGDAEQEGRDSGDKENGEGKGGDVDGNAEGNGDK